MKLVAKKDFANVGSLALEASKHNLKHPMHVHKGVRFAVGTTEIFDDLKQAEKVVVAQLISSKSAVIDNDANKALVAKIDAEAAAEVKAEQAASAKVQSLPELIAAAVATALSGMKPAK